jgi:hypothetical protein
MRPGSLRCCSISMKRCSTPWSLAYMVHSPVPAAGAKKDLGRGEIRPRPEGAYPIKMHVMI